MRKNHASGLKVSGRHTTVIDAAQPIFKAATESPLISKISPGIIFAGKHSHRRLKFKPVLAGFELTVYGNTTIQVLYVYTKHPHEARAELEQAFNQAFGS